MALRLIALVVGVAALVVVGCTRAPGPGSSEPGPSGTTAWMVTEPVDGAVVSAQTIEVRGTAPEGTSVIQDIRLGQDKEAIVSGGRWAITVDLDEGDNELTFRLGDDEDHATTIHVTYSPTVATPMVTPSPSPHPLLAAMVQFMGENFGVPGDATWWVHIKGFAIEGDTVVVTTDLIAHDDNAKGVCSAASNLAFEFPESGLREGAVEIRGEDGTTIWKRLDVSQPC